MTHCGHSPDDIITAGRVNWCRRCEERAMNYTQATMYLETNRDELNRMFNEQYPNLPNGGFYNPRVQNVSNGVIELFCYYDGYDNEDDGWTWFFDTAAGRFYN